MVAVLLPTSIVGTRVQSLYDTYDEYPADSSFVRGARLYSRHFHESRGVTELTLLVTADAPWDQHHKQLRGVLDGIAAALNEKFPLVYQRDLDDPLGGRRKSGGASPTIVERLGASGFSIPQVRDAYIGRGQSTARIDLGLGVEPRSLASMQLVEQIRSVAQQVVERMGTLGDTAASIDVAGEAAFYADMRALRIRDFRVIAAAACTLIYLILLWLIRAPVQSAVLLAATLLTYLAAYGGTFLIVHQVYGLSGLSWQVDFLLFIIIMSLGQDYNIFVVTRIHEELRNHPPREAIAVAIRKTGRVVSGCGIIMAATFASMFSGSLLVLKEFAIALPLGILIDTFVVRPLLVPAVILLLYQWAPANAVQHSKVRALG